MSLSHWLIAPVTASCRRTLWTGDAAAAVARARIRVEVNCILNIEKFSVGDSGKYVKCMRCVKWVLVVID